MDSLKRFFKNFTLKKSIITIMLSIILVITLGAGYFYYEAEHSLSSIKRSKLLPQNSHTTNSQSISLGKPINYLLLGSDSRDLSNDPGRSDSIMMVHIPADRKHVYLISLPRDLYVNIPGYDAQKINAAYGYGGAPLTVSTVQNFFNTTIDHVAIVNFNSFVGLVDKLGGVTINNPYTGCDTSQNICWKKGELKLTSYDALHYVRWRHGLPEGDITRAENQQRVMKAIVAKSLSGNTLHNPSTLMNLITSVSKFLTVDSTLSNSEMVKTLTNLNISSANDVRSLTVPIYDYKNIPPYGDVDLVNGTREKELQEALTKDTLESYWTKYHNQDSVGSSPNDQILWPDGTNNNSSSTTSTSSSSTNTSTSSLLNNPYSITNTPNNTSNNSSTPTASSTEKN